MNNRSIGICPGCGSAGCHGNGCRYTIQPAAGAPSSTWSNNQTYGSMFKCRSCGMDGSHVSWCSSIQPIQPSYGAPHASTKATPAVLQPKFLDLKPLLPKATVTNTPEVATPMLKPKFDDLTLSMLKPTKPPAPTRVATPVSQPLLHDLRFKFNVITPTKVTTLAPQPQLPFSPKR